MGIWGYLKRATVVFGEGAGLKGSPEEVIGSDREGTAESLS